MTAAATKVIGHIQDNACQVLNAGCFAAGTKLWTPLGWRTVEEILEGEWVFARNELDPNGRIEAKLVEKKFERTGSILDMCLPGGRKIRTTPEHPFHEYHKGWTAAGALAAGDVIRTDDGWVQVKEVIDTGIYEKVYNVRVADYHTYFVGGEDWGFAVWAHNDYNRLADVLANAPELANSTNAILLSIAKRMPQAQSARYLSQADFTRLLETKLYNQNLLKQTSHLSDETSQAAKAAAEIHGNTGRTPTILINPSAPNPYTAGTIAATQWDEITAFSNSNPTVQALRFRLQLPGQPKGGRYLGLPYELLRAQYYASQGQLVEVEQPTHTPAGAVNGECDLLLSGNRLIDTKAWSWGMWSAASIGKQRGMIAGLDNEVRKYLGDPAGYTLRIEFRYRIPPDVLSALNMLAALPAYQGRLTWAANQI